MEISERGLALIRQFEGFSATPYLCPAGKRTIGYGHVIKTGEIFPVAGIDEDRAEVILKQDVNISERAVLRLCGEGLSQGQFDALVSFVYNIGIKAFELSTLLRYLRQKSPEKAAGEFPRWIYAGGVKMPGLIARRAAEKAVFLA